jgi:formyl-CoA transferase
LQAVSVPVGRIYTVKDIAEDPHYQARGMLQRIVTATGLTLDLPGIVPQLSATPGGIRTLAPTLGQHNTEVLGDTGWEPPIARAERPA